MSKEVASEDQVLTIPKGWFVSGCYFDKDPPTCRISKEDDVLEERTLLIPPALAYYLSTHFCGSYKMQKIYKDQAVRELQCKFRDLLGVNDE